MTSSAVHAMLSQALIEKAVATSQAEQPDQPVLCDTADVSDQCGEVWDALAEWLPAEGHPASSLMESGSGPLLWVRSGHVILHILQPIHYDAAKLVAVSRSAFAPDAEPDSANSDS